MDAVNPFLDDFLEDALANAGLGEAADGDPLSEITRSRFRDTCHCDGSIGSEISSDDSSIEFILQAAKESELGCRLCLSKV